MLLISVFVKDLISTGVPASLVLRALELSCSALLLRRGERLFALAAAPLIVACGSPSCIESTVHGGHQPLHEVRRLVRVGHTGGIDDVFVDLPLVRMQPRARR